MRATFLHFFIDPKGKKMVATATLSAKFQISIPKAVREAQQWQAGQEFAFFEGSLTQIS